MKNQGREFFAVRKDDGDPYSINHLILGGCNTNGEPRPGFENMNLLPRGDVSLTKQTVKNFLNQNNI